MAMRMPKRIATGIPRRWTRVRGASATALVSNSDVPVAAVRLPFVDICCYSHYDNRARQRDRALRSRNNSAGTEIEVEGGSSPSTVHFHLRLDGFFCLNLLRI